MKMRPMRETGSLSLGPAATVIACLHRRPESKVDIPAGWKVYDETEQQERTGFTMQIRYSLCPKCDACPEVVFEAGTVLIGEEGNQVRLSVEEWNVLVAAVKDETLGAVESPAVSTDQSEEDCGECCGSAS
jgi:hypothetical protein